MGLNLARAAVAFFAASSFSTAAPCVSGNIVAYEALGPAGCSIGSFLFRSFSANSGVPNFPDFDDNLPKGEIFLSPSLVDPSTARFDIDFSSYTSSKSSVHLDLFFTMAPNWPATGVSSVTWGKIVDLDADLIGVNGFQCITCSGPSSQVRKIISNDTITTVTHFPEGSTQFLFYTAIVHNSDILTNDPGDSVEFKNGFIQISFDAPEPATFFVAASGLIAVALLRRFRG